MNDSKNERILQQVMDIFRGPIPAHDSLVFSLQLLCWAKISKDNHMPDGLKIQARPFADPHWVRDVWSDLGQRSGIIGAAYSGGKIPARLEASRLGAAIELCMHLSETGVMDSFDPSESISQIVGRDIGEYFLPVELIHAMTTLAGIGQGSSVYCPWDSCAQLAAQAAKMGASAYVETANDPMLPALVSMFAAEGIEIAHGDPIREPTAVEGGKLRQFDTCVSFPPLGLRYTAEVIGRDWYNRFQDRRSSGAVLAVRHIMAQTTGRALIAVPYSLLFSPGGERALREDLIKQEAIEAVISMPSGLLVNTNTSFALLVLDMRSQHKTIRFINAESDHFREPIPRARARARLVDIEGIISRVDGAITDSFVAEVHVDEVVRNDYILQVNRYVLPEWQRKIEDILAASKTRHLGDIVTLVRPMPLASGDDIINALEVVTADLPEMGYIPPPTKDVQIDRTSALRRQLFLRPYDVLLIIKGSVGKVGIISETVPEPGEGGWLAGQSAVVLRVDDPKELDPRTLAMYLRSPLGQKQLEAIAVQGATIPMIQLRELQRLLVVIPTKKEAAEIGGILDEQAKIQCEIEKLRAQQAELAKHVWTLD